jgi:hypothetical protein
MLSVFAVWRQSDAAFISTTPTSSSLSTGTVAISDDDSDSTLINTSLAAGQSASACIKVDFTGTATAGVRLYATVGSGASGLGSQVRLTVMEGTGGSFAGGCGTFVATSTSYTGTFGGFLTAKTDWSTGVSSWSASPTSATRTYRFIWTVLPGTTATYWGTTVSANFVWESKT